MKNGIRTLIYSVSHFLMDFMCHYYAFFLIKRLVPDKVLVIYILYNFIAFALQCPIGAFCDRFEPKKSVSVSFIILILGYCLGFLFFQNNAVMAVAGLMICAVANAACHAGGYAAVSKTGPEGLINGGVFISFGALGVGLGDYLGSNGISIALWTMLAAAFMVLLVNLPIVQSEKEGMPDHTGEEKTEIVLLILCLIAVFARSYGGFILPGSFKAIGIHPSVLGFAGKFAGGFLVIIAAKALRKKTDLRFINSLYGALALLISTMLLVGLGANPYLCALGVFLFNSVMPVTLYEVYCIFPEAPGFSLGLTTVLLFLGFLPSCFFFPGEGLKRALLLILCLIASACLMTAAFLNRSKEKRRA